MYSNIAKPGDGLDESPTVMVGEAKKSQKFGKNRGEIKPNIHHTLICYLADNIWSMKSQTHREENESVWTEAEVTDDKN